MPFQTPQGIEQLLALFRMMQQPQQANVSRIQGMMGLQNPFGAAPQQAAMPNTAATAPPSFTGQPGGLPISQYGYGAEHRFHQPFPFVFKPVKKPTGFFSTIQGKQEKQMDIGDAGE